jgi:two-component system, LuxR family, sensor kinase FixL
VPSLNYVNLGTRSGLKLDHRELAPRSAWTIGVSNLATSKFWLTGIAFLVAYLFLNILTVRYQFHDLGITLWSPDNGLSVLLLIEGAEFAPFVLIGGVLADVLINNVHHNIYVTVFAETALTLAYTAFAAVLRDILNFSPRRTSLSGVIAMLSAVPVGAMATSMIYCGTLYLTESLPVDQVVSALRHFWIGDAVGMIVIIPAASAAFILLSKARWNWRRNEVLNWSVFIVASCLGFAIVHSASGANAYHLFYLLFLPIIWIAMRAGYVGVAIALLATQTAFFLTASYIGIDASDFDQFQVLMLVLSTTGLLLGAVVTERERANLLLREQQTELARVSAHATAGAMGMLLAHELSQPLSTVAAYTLAARRMLRSGGDSEPVIAALDKAEAEMSRTREVLERIRDFVSAGRMESSLLDIVEVVQKIRALCDEGANSRNVEIAVESIRPVPLVKADRIGIEQVLNNIVGNAVDAAAARGDASGRVVIRLIERGDLVIVEIDDNGPGVAPEMAKSLFEPYQTSKPRGMGLGLTLSRQIVQKHAGRLRWQPLVPEGTRFVVELNIIGPDARSNSTVIN